MKNKYRVGTKIVHKKGGVYTVVELPDVNKLLAETGNTFYVYKRGDILWYRDKSEMEDESRFKKLKQ